MAKENGNGKAILIAIVICIIIGVFFVFGIDKKIASVVNYVGEKISISKESKKSGFDINNNPELANIPALPNLVVVWGGIFSTNEITIKEGEVVSFYNADESPIKIIGSDWQSAFIDNSGVFTKGDLSKGEYTAYLESNPDQSIKIKVK
jgi:hypothetical protein